MLLCRQKSRDPAPPTIRNGESRGDATATPHRTPAQDEDQRSEDELVLLLLVRARGVK